MLSMRLMAADTKTFTLKRAVTVQSDYIGTGNVYQNAGQVTGQLTAASDRVSVELYGTKASSMFTLIVPCDTDIRKNDRVTLHDGDYTVKSVLWFGTHKTAALERVGVFDGSN